MATSACSSSNDSADETTAAPAPAPETTVASTTSSAAPAPSTTGVPAGPVAPLTGLASTDPGIVNRPALVVKIDNHEDARPQTGLNQADIVVEELVEGISRFAAVFQSQEPGGSTEVGPIRSARTSDLAIITARKRLLNLARDLQQGIEPFPASHGDIYRVRAMDVNTPVDNFDAMIASHGNGLLAKA